MATRKSTTAKTKTTKRPVRTAAAKTRTTKSVTKATAKTVTKPVPINRWPGLTLDRIWIVSAVLFIALAVAAPFVMERVASMISQTHVTRDLLLSQDETAFISATKPVWDMELRWAVSGLMALSAILPILYLTRLKGWYANRLANGRVLETRWIDLGVTSALMVEVIALLSGYNNLATLKLMGGAMALTAGLGWLAERQNAKARRPDWSAYGLSLFAGALPWLAIAAATVATILFGEVRSPWYVYAVSATTLAGFVALAINQRNQHRRFRNWADYTLVERNYALINLVTKVAFAGLLMVGLFQA